MEKVKAAKPVTSRRGGKTTSSANSNTTAILAQHDAACTAIALLTDAIADIAVETEDAQLVGVALYLNRTTGEWRCIGNVLSNALQHAFIAGKVGQP